jgi:predicted transcriptional regulator
MVSLTELSEIDRAEWDDTTVGDVLRSDLPEVRPSWTLRDAIGAMGDSDVDVLAVTDADASFIGLVREDDILKLDEILEETGG